MVSRSGVGITRRLNLALSALLICAGCAPATATRGGTSDGLATGALSTTTTTQVGTTVTSTPPPGASEAARPARAIPVETMVPEGAGPFPAVVLVHGGGWVGGSPDLMSDLAGFLTEEGYLTLNTGYTRSNGVTGYPAAVDDVSCAVRQAASHPDSDGSVAVIGHSAGAHIAALVALDPGRYGTGCPITQPVLPDRLVGLAGPYDVTRLGPLLLPFFGVGPSEDPELWAAGNPLLHAANNPELSTLLMHGENDGLVDYSFAADFATSLTQAGSEVLIEVIEGARHRDMHDPSFVGDLIVTWLDRD